MGGKTARRRDGENDNKRQREEVDVLGIWGRLHAGDILYCGRFTGRHMFVRLIAWLVARGH